MEPVLDKIYEKLKWLREKGNSISRYGSADEKGEVTQLSCYVCYAELRRGDYPKSYYLFSAWNGEPFGVNKAPKEHREWGGDRDQPEKRRSSFQPGPLSDLWLEFMLNPEFSPWKAIHEHLVTTDPVIIRESGFIFKNAKDINFGLLFNFLIASRYAYEFNHRVLFWKELIEKYGVDPRAAYLLSISFKKNEGDNKKPPLRKVLVREAGYRKNPGGFRYIRDEYGEKKFFPAEYEEVDDHPDWKQGDWDGKLSGSVGDGHCPLNSMNGYAGRILKSDADLTVHKAFKECGAYGGAQAWDIFLTRGEKTYDGPNQLQDVLNHFETLKGKSSQCLRFSLLVAIS